MKKVLIAVTLIMFVLIGSIFIVKNVKLDSRTNCWKYADNIQDQTEIHKADAGIAMEGDEKEKMEVTVGLALYTAEDVNIRSEASTNSDILHGVSQGTNLWAVSNVIDGWVRVAYDGDWGYVRAEYVKIKAGQNLEIKELEGELLIDYDESVAIKTADGNIYEFDTDRVSEYEAPDREEGMKVLIRYRGSLLDDPYLISMDLLTESGETEARKYQ